MTLVLDLDKGIVTREVGQESESQHSQVVWKSKGVGKTIII